MYYLLRDKQENENMFEIHQKNNVGRVYVNFE